MRKLSLFLIIVMVIALTGCTITINGKEAYSFNWNFAGSPVEKTEVIDEVIDKQNSLSVSNVSGKTVIIPWDQDSLQITAVKKLKGGVSYGKTGKSIDDLEVKVEKSSSNILVSVKYINGLWGFSHQNVELEIKVPKKIINIAANSASGDIRVDNFMESDEFKLTSVSGNIEASNLTAKEFEFGSASGNMNISEVNGNGYIRTVSGDIDIRDINGDIVYKTASGDMSINNMEGGAAFTSVSGDLDLKSTFLKSSHFSSASGEISVEASKIDNSGKYEFNTVSGDISLNIPKDAGFNLDINTLSGDINSEFDFVTSNNRDKSHRKWIKGEVGGGGSILDIHTTSGDIQLSKN